MFFEVFFEDVVVVAVFEVRALLLLLFCFLVCAVVDVVLVHVFAVDGEGEGGIGTKVVVLAAVTAAAAALLFSGVGLDGSKECCGCDEEAEKLFVFLLFLPELLFTLFFSPGNLFRGLLFSFSMLPFVSSRIVT